MTVKDIIAAVLAALCAVICAFTSLTGTEMNINDFIQAAPGSIIGGPSTVDPENAVRSRDLVSFSYVCGVQEDASPSLNILNPGSLPIGRYDLYLGPGENGELVCRAKFNTDISVEFHPEESALKELADILSDIGATEINGYYASNSALGSYLDVKGEYASGEHLSIHSEGGAGVGPGIDFSAVEKFFNELAEKNGERFVTRYSNDELCAAFFDWAMKNVPGISENDKNRVKVELRETYGGVNIRFVVTKSGGGWKWVALAEQVDSLTLKCRNARYLAVGYNDGTEVKIGEITLPDENIGQYKALFAGVEPVSETPPFSGIG